jgi:hypothetical protein
MNDDRSVEISWMGKAMKELLLALMRRLESIEAKYGDLPPREFLGTVIFRSFIRPEPGYALPDDYGLDSPEANKAVRYALQAFINTARQQAPKEGFITFQQRQRAIQDLEVYTEQGNSMDDFFGNLVPSLYTETGGKLG